MPELIYYVECILLTACYCLSGFSHSGFSLVNFFFFYSLADNWLFGICMKAILLFMTLHSGLLMLI